MVAGVRVPYLVTSRAHTEADEAARLSGLFPAPGMRGWGGPRLRKDRRAGGRAERCCIHPTNTLSPSTAWGWDGIISKSHRHHCASLLHFFMTTTQQLSRHRASFLHVPWAQGYWRQGVMVSWLLVRSPSTRYARPEAYTLVPPRLCLSPVAVADGDAALDTRNCPFAALAARWHRHPDWRARSS